MKILVIAMAGIGDSILATPLIHELRQAYPDAQIDALVMWAGAKSILEDNPWLNTVYQKNLLKERKTDSVRFLRSVGQQRYDLSINAHPQSRIHYRIIARIVGASRRVSHKYECWTRLDSLLVGETLEQNYSIHTVEQNLAFLGLLGKRASLAEHRLEIFLKPEQERWADEFVAAQALGEHIRLGVHTGSGGTKNLAFKRWPQAHYVQLFKALTRDVPRMSILLFGGPEEQESLRQIQEQTGSPALLVAPGDALQKTGALMTRCHSFLSVDTALMHVAAALRVPGQIVIEAPTLNKTNLPYRNPYTLVANPAVAGKNLDYYRYDGKGIKGTPEQLVRCMASVSVESVYDAVRKTLRA